MSSESQPAPRSSGAFVWVNIGADDLARAEKFYSTVFNWSFVTSALNQEDKDKPDPNILYFKPPTPPGHSPTMMGGLVKTKARNLKKVPDATSDSGDATIYLLADSLAQKMKEIIASGGKKGSEVSSIGEGFLQHFEDTEGNYMGMYSRVAE